MKRNVTNIVEYKRKTIFIFLFSEMLHFKFMSTISAKIFSRLQKICFPFFIYHINNKVREDFRRVE